MIVYLEVTAGSVNKTVYEAIKGAKTFNVMGGGVGVGVVWLGVLSCGSGLVDEVQNAWNVGVCHGVSCREGGSFGGW